MAKWFYHFSEIWPDLIICVFQQMFENNKTLLMVSPVITSLDLYLTEHWTDFILMFSSEMFSALRLTDQGLSYHIMWKWLQNSNVDFKIYLINVPLLMTKILFNICSPVELQNSGDNSALYSPDKHSWNLIFPFLVKERFSHCKRFLNWKMHFPLC